MSVYLYVIDVRTVTAVAISIQITPNFLHLFIKRTQSSDFGKYWMKINLEQISDFSVDL